MKSEPIITTNLKSKILGITLLFFIVWSIVVTFYKYIVLQDYTVIEVVEEESISL